MERTGDELAQHAAAMAKEDIEARKQFLERAESEYQKASERKPVHPQVAAYRSHKLRILRDILDNPFSLRVDAAADSQSPTPYYFTRARESLTERDPMLITWTAPIATLRHGKPGETVTVFTPNGPAEHLVRAKGTYGRCGISIEDVVYELLSGRISVPSLDELIASVDGIAPPTARLTDQPFRPPAHIGLREIIFETDRNQDEQLRYPMKGHLVIEGAPGSGKTTIALQRIVYVIDQQYDLLGLSRQSPRFSEGGTVVFVLSETLESYLEVLLHDLQLHDVVVHPVRQFIAGGVRERGVAKSLREAPEETDGLRYLKAVAHVLPALRRTAAEGATKRLLGLKSALSNETLLPTNTPGEIDIYKNVAEKVGEMALSAGRGLGNIGGRLGALLEEVDQWRKTYPSRESDFRDLRSRLVDGVREAVAPADLLREFVLSPACEGVANEVLGVPVLGHSFNPRDSVAEWRRQWENGRITYRDLVLLGWIIQWQTEGMLDGKSPAGMPRPWPRFSHIIVDEGQDLSEVEMRLILSMASPGTNCVTVVGDLVQRLNWPEGLDSWADGGLVLNGEDGYLGLFRLNYRQTWELGHFAAVYHRDVFGRAPQFDPSDKKRGPWPVLYGAASHGEAAEHAAEAIRQMLDRNPNHSVAVLV